MLDTLLHPIHVTVKDVQLDKATGLYIDVENLTVANTTELVLDDDIDMGLFGKDFEKQKVAYIVFKEMVIKQKSLKLGRWKEQINSELTSISPKKPVIHKFKSLKVSLIEWPPLQPYLDLIVYNLDNLLVSLCKCRSRGFCEKYIRSQSSSYNMSPFHIRAQYGNIMWGEWKIKL